MTKSLPMHDVLPMAELDAALAEGMSDSMAGRLISDEELTHEFDAEFEAAGVDLS